MNRFDGITAFLPATESEGINLSQEAVWISRLITSAALFEVGTEPSPGLVSPKDNGAHSDMSMFTFFVSSSVLQHYFAQCAQAGIEQFTRPGEMLDRLRPLGLKAEEEMLQNTRGVNTHKGLIFLGGILAGAAGVTLKRKGAGHIEYCDIFNTVKKISNGIIAGELLPLKRPGGACGRRLTGGELNYIRFGVTGIRGEAENGLLSVKNTGLVALRRALAEGMCVNDAMVEALISLMTVVDDTTVLSRHSMDVLEFVKKEALKAVMAGSVYTEEGRKHILDMHAEFVKRRISPGGCADLLAVTVAVRLLCDGPFSKEQLTGTSVFKKKD